MAYRILFRFFQNSHNHRIAKISHVMKIVEKDHMNLGWHFVYTFSTDREGTHK